MHEDITTTAIAGNDGLLPKGKRLSRSMQFVQPATVLNMANNNGSGGNSFGDDSLDGDGAIQTIDKVDVPKKYKVVVLNDDYTPMDFVVLVLKRFFNKTEEQATAIMLDVHKKGAGVAGIYTLEIAEMRVMQCNQFARTNQHPLKTTLEPE